MKPFLARRVFLLMMGCTYASAFPKKEDWSTCMKTRDITGTRVFVANFEQKKIVYDNIKVECRYTRAGGRVGLKNVWAISRLRLCWILYPCNLSLTGEDFAFTFKWDLQTQPMSGSGSGESSDGDVTEEEGGNGDFTVFKLLISRFGDNDKYVEEEEWVEVRGCVRIQGNECEVEEFLQYSEPYTFWVANSQANTDVLLENILDQSQVLDYVPEYSMTFSAPIFSASRYKSTVYVEFHSKTLKVEGENLTIPQYLSRIASYLRPKYEIRYFQDNGNNSLPEKIHYRTISALERSANITTSIPVTSALCLGVRFANDELSIATNPSEFTTVCLPSEVDLATSVQQSIVNVDYVKLGVLVIICTAVLMVLLFLCYRNKKFFKKFLSIKEIHIPETTNDILKEDPGSPTLLDGHGCSGNMKIVDFLTPTHGDDDVFHITSYLLSSEKANRDLFSENSLRQHRENHRYEIALKGTGHNIPRLREQPSTSLYDGDNSSSILNQNNEQNPTEGVIVYEHMPGPYVTDSMYVTNEQASRIYPSMSSLDEAANRPSEQMPGHCFPNGRPKPRYLSEDSAFYDDFAPCIRSDESSTIVGETRL